MKKLKKIKLEKIDNDGSELQPLNNEGMNRIRGGTYTLDTLTVRPSGNSWDGNDPWGD